MFAGSPEPEPNSLWKIQFDKELATYADTSINLQHIKSNKLLGVCFYQERDGQGYYYNDQYMCVKNYYHKSPLTNHTEGSKFVFLFI